MRYSQEFKLECINLYKQGIWQTTLHRQISSSAQTPISHAPNPPLITPALRAFDIDAPGKGGDQLDEGDGKCTYLTPLAEAPPRPLKF